MAGRPMALGTTRMQAAAPAVRRRLPSGSVLTQSRARMALVGLLAGTLGLAFMAPGLARPLFVLGCAAVGAIAWREGCGRSVEVAISLYVFAPFLRRIVDLGIGFDTSSTMLLGPVLAIAIPAVDLRHMLVRRHRDDAALLPMLLVGACITYGMLLSAFSGEFGRSARQR